jgi:hypothetical protein
MAPQGRARGGRPDAGRASVRRNSIAERFGGVVEEIRPARADPQSRDVRGLARCDRDRGPHRRARAVRPLQRIAGLQRRCDGHSAADRVVRQFRRGAGGRARQGKSRLPAQGQDRVDGQPAWRVRTSRAGAGDVPAQRRSGPRRKRREHSGRRRGRRRRGLCRRVCDHRRVGAGAQGAGNGHVLVGHRRHAGHLGSDSDPRHRRRRPTRSRSPPCLPS